MAEFPLYQILISGESIERLSRYQGLLSKDLNQAGHGFRSQLEGLAVGDLTTEDFLQALLKTKRACIFAEGALRGDGTDWTSEEVSILGDVVVSVPVTVFDNGVWYASDPNFRPHDQPFRATLLFVPGALLSNTASPDYKEVLDDNNDLSFDKYSRLMKRRLLPVFEFINHSCSDDGALVLIPGIGCGLFAGKWKSVLSEMLRQTLQDILSESDSRFKNIKYVVYDPFVGEKKTTKIGDVEFRQRPFQKCLKSQLCQPKEFEEAGDDFSKLTLFKLVAWDHLSLPGNDYFVGSRDTDDGVASAATDCMKAITGVEGKYDGKGHYLPPKEYRTWEQVVFQKQVHLMVGGNLRVCVA